jgi:hypothetical protein
VGYLYVLIEDSFVSIKKLKFPYWPSKVFTFIDFNFFYLIGYHNVKVGVEKAFLSMVVFLWLMLLVKAIYIYIYI